MKGRTPQNIRDVIENTFNKIIKPEMDFLKSLPEAPEYLDENQHLLDFENEIPLIYKGEVNFQAAAKYRIGATMYDSDAGDSN